jgi:hypothetical protein
VELHEELRRLLLLRVSVQELSWIDEQDDRKNRTTWSRGVVVVVATVVVISVCVPPLAAVPEVGTFGVLW